MYSISDHYCRICLNPSESNVDIHSITEDGLDFVAKLEVCVPEVNWKDYDTLPLCTNCLEQLNKVYEFKKLCLQSHTLYKKLSEICANDKLKKKFTTSIKKEKCKKFKNSIAISGLPDLQSLKSTKTIFSNFCITPTTLTETKCDNSLNKKTPHLLNTSISLVRSQTDSKQSKINQIEQENPNVILESKTEEVSIEIDPMDYDLSEEIMYPSKDSTDCDYDKDWEDEIQTNEITKNNSEDTDPILQNLLNKNSKENNENLDIHSGHFLTTNNIKEKFVCELCFRVFENEQHLWCHKKYQHNDNNDDNYEDDTSDIDHDNTFENSITLKDFMVNSFDFKCPECKRHFSSAKRLNKHIESYHGTKIQRKYFTKGSKNAKCDICDKEVSTQAYLQIHKRLHYKKGEFEPSKL